VTTLRRRTGRRFASPPMFIEFLLRELGETRAATLDCSTVFPRVKKKKSIDGSRTSASWKRASGGPIHTFTPRRSRRACGRGRCWPPARPFAPYAFDRSSSLRQLIAAEMTPGTVSPRFGASIGRIRLWRSRFRCQLLRLRLHVVISGTHERTLYPRRRPLGLILAGVRKTLIYTRRWSAATWAWRWFSMPPGAKGFLGKLAALANLALLIQAVIALSAG